MRIPLKVISELPFIFGAILMLGGVLVFFSPWASFLELWFLYQMSLTMFCSGVVCFAVGCVAKLLVLKDRS